MNQKITIAIDGYSSCGKSTLAKDLARALGYAYVDSGAMYRATALYFIRNQVNQKDTQAVQDALSQIHITFQVDETGKNRTYLNGEDVEDEIRNPEVSKHVSPVAAISEVRKIMVEQQREIGKGKGVVMDGRDIGTVVFPFAELKIFLTADTEIRTKRRLDEMMAKNQKVTFQEVKKNLKERDRIDSSRADSPLRKAFDAVEVDNTEMTKQQQLDLVLDLAQRRIRIEENTIAPKLKK